MGLIRYSYSCHQVNWILWCYLEDWSFDVTEKRKLNSVLLEVVESGYNAILRTGVLVLQRRGGLIQYYWNLLNLSTKIIVLHLDSEIFGSVR